jgi:hypothetical protein
MTDRKVVKGGKGWVRCGGGGTRTHKPLRAPVFKTGSLTIRSTPPGLLRLHYTN